MKVGVHIALWMKTWQDDVVPYIETAARLGFDGVELSLLGMTDDNIARVRKTLQENHLQVTCTTGLNMGQDITSDDPEIRKEGLRYLEHSIKTVAALGSPLLSGVIYAPWGKRVMQNRQERWERSVEALKAVAPFAAEHGVTLGIEAINRFETDLVNTASQAGQMANDINEKNIGVLLDTYHMNMEEKHMGVSLQQSKDKLVHLHCVENDRGVPGSGHIPWAEVFSNLKQINYQGWLTLELFIQANQAVSPDLAIWRDIETDPTEAAKQGLQFLRENAR
jgi:D-psicose/D-tagatose/L-ribulose 3-epimerase